MAIFLSRIKKALNLGTKSITQNGTYNASSDGYDGYSSVDVAIPTPPSITPSNATPAAMTANTPVNPTANGYAIESYSSVTPSNTPTSVATNDVVKIGGSGVIVDSLPTIQSSKSVTATTSQQTVGPDTGYDAITEIVVNPQEHSAFFVPLQNEPYNDMGVHNNYRYVDTSGMVVPHPISPSNSNPVSIAPSYPIEYTANGYAIESYSSITPSNSSPATITSGSIYKASANGKAVASVTDITPSNSSPVSLSSGSIYKPSASGYAISSYSSKTPSDSSPASVSSGAIIKNGGSSTGYLYASSGLKKVKTGSVTLTASSNNTITTGFQPKYICWSIGTGSLSAYNQDISTTQFKKAGSSGISNVNIGTTASYNLMSISSTGFVIRGASSAVTMDYFAIG